MQVVGYQRDVGAGASLLLAEAGAVRSVPLDPGADLRYALGPRHCAGTLLDDGHRACANDAAPYCAAHRDTWVCARCTGTCLKDEMDCHDEHAVYLAAFAPATFKVGVTRLERLPTRVREQGADRAAHVLTLPDGRVARQREAEIARDVGDRVRVAEKIRGLHRAVDERAWDRLLADFDPKREFAPDYGLSLRDQPVPETMATGTVVGTKGRLLVLERDGSRYAVDMRDLVGHELAAGESQRDRQASLGAFS
ncbi:MAG: DUF2797 domain-containing protein [Haloarculaceae archaeon]